MLVQRELRMVSVKSGFDTELMGSVTGTIIEGRFYIIGGSRNSYEHLGSTLQYSLHNQEPPVRLADTPTPRGNMTSASFGNDIFVVAGLRATKSGDKWENHPSCNVECLNVKSRVWKQCAPLPEVRVKPGLAFVNGTLYALSGRVDEVDASTIFAYDPTADNWKLIFDGLPFASRHGAACSVGETIYFCGGHSCHPGGGHFQASMISYSTRTAEVRSHAPLPEPRAAHSLLAVGNHLYALGGLDSSKNSVTSVFRYDLQIERWETCQPLNSPRSVFAAAVYGEAIYLAGGWKRMGKESNPSLERYEALYW